MKESTESTESMELTIDVLTGSGMPKDALKFLWLYIPIIWFAGTITLIQFTSFWKDFFGIPILFYLLLPFVIFGDIYIFLGCSLFFTKLLLIFINLIHKPKEGIFHIREDRRVYLFWCIRKLLKKFVIWFARNTPLPYVDIIAFRCLGVKVNFSNSILDSWLDLEFIEAGKKVFIGQGSTVCSGIVVGNYLIIKRIIFEDLAIVGGQSVVSPGTIIRKNTILGAASITSFNQELEKDWVYMGIPARKFKLNKYAESNREIIIKKDVELKETSIVKYEKIENKEGEK